MMKTWIARMLGLTLAGIIASASAGETAQTIAGTVKTVKGDVRIERGSERLTANVGVGIRSTDRIVTGAGASVGITLRDSSLLSAGPNSVLDLNEFAFDPATHAGKVDATLKQGTLAVVSGKIAKADPDAVRFRTPTVTLGVRGTEFVLEADGTD